MVTLKEIANVVGVSTATVSRVLNFDATLSITAKKRQAIIETAEALNYATPRNRNRANAQGLSKVALVHFLRPEQELIDLARAKRVALYPDEDWDTRVFVLGPLAETYFEKDSHGGMLGSKRYFAVDELAPTDIQDLATKLRDVAWSDLA